MFVKKRMLMLLNLPAEPFAPQSMQANPVLFFTPCESAFLLYRTLHSSPEGCCLCLYRMLSSNMSLKSGPVRYVHFTDRCEKNSKLRDKETFGRLMILAAD